MAKRAPAAHRDVRKVNANDYTTSMTGLKFKIAYRKAEEQEEAAAPLPATKVKVVKRRRAG